MVGKLNITEEQLIHINKALEDATAEEVLKWAITTFPNLYQTTAFGLTGLVTVDMLSKVSKDNEHPVDLIFIDTLYHFPQTLDLIERVKNKYNVNIHTFKPKSVEDEKQFEEKYGENLWETNDKLYDYLVKVEPSQRAYEEISVDAVLTGRRRSQGGARGNLPVIEIEKESGVVKINPLHNWNFSQVKEYIDKYSVPYNELLDLGYKSVGDWHSTEPVAEGEDERSGRWKGKAKTECGIHETSKYAEFLKEQAKVAA